jgi:hypothetical protein
MLMQAKLVPLNHFAKFASLDKRVTHPQKNIRPQSAQLDLFSQDTFI